MRTLSDNKVRRLAAELGPKLHEEHFEDVLRAIVDARRTSTTRWRCACSSTVAALAGGEQTFAAVRRLDPSGSADCSA